MVPVLIPSEHFQAYFSCVLGQNEATTHTVSLLPPHCLYFMHHQRVFSPLPWVLVHTAVSDDKCCCVFWLVNVDLST